MRKSFLRRSGIISGSGTAPVLPTTAYTNEYGQGDRTSIITGTTNMIITGPLSNAVDGLIGIDADDSWWFSGTYAVAGNYVRFQMNAPQFIDEISWHQFGASGLGVWKWQASNDASTWVDMSGDFTLGGFSGVTATTLTPADDTGYIYWQLLGVSGNTSNATFNREITFKTVSTGPPVDTFLAFRAIRDSGTQTTGGTGTTTEVTFTTVQFDTAGAFAANRFTVPPGRDGTYMVFNVGVEALANDNMELQIQRSTDGGTNFTTITGNSTIDDYWTGTSGPVPVAVGEVYRYAIFMHSNSAEIDASQPNTYFSGYTLP